MTALFAIITFFFIFVVVYLTITTVLAVAAWWLKRCTSGESVEESVDEIDRRMDRIKDRAFIIALVLTFFIVTPFVVITVFVKP